MSTTANYQYVVYGFDLTNSLREIDDGGSTSFDSFPHLSNRGPLRWSRLHIMFVRVSSASSFGGVLDRADFDPRLKERDP